MQPFHGSGVNWWRTGVDHGKYAPPHVWKSVVRSGSLGQPQAPSALQDSHTLWAHIDHVTSPFGEPEPVDGLPKNSRVIGDMVLVVCRRRVWLCLVCLNW